MSFDSEDRDKELCQNIIEAYAYTDRYTQDMSHEEFLTDVKTHWICAEKYLGTWLLKGSGSIKWKYR